MTIKTLLNPQDFLQILSQYALGEYISHEPIAEGTVQTNYILITNLGKFLFRLYENRSKESCLFEGSLIEHLTTNAYPCPKIYRNRKNELISEYRSKPYAIFEFIDGEHIENPSSAQKKQLIQHIAHLHMITKDYTPIHLDQRLNYTPETCVKLAEESARRINDTNATQKFTWLKNEVKKLELPTGLPMGICHCDFHFSNVLFSDRKFKALIDFDDANYTYLLFDLAAVSEIFIPSFNHNTWQEFIMTDQVFDFSEMHNVVAVYEKIRSLTMLEKQHFFDVYKLMILFDCIWYFSRGQVEDFYERKKLTYLNHLGREKFYHSVFYQ